MLTSFYSFFFFNDTATTEIYTLSLHDALPISCRMRRRESIEREVDLGIVSTRPPGPAWPRRTTAHPPTLQRTQSVPDRLLGAFPGNYGRYSVARSEGLGAPG